MEQVAAMKYFRLYSTLVIPTIHLCHIPPAQWHQVILLLWTLEALQSKCDMFNIVLMHLIHKHNRKLQVNMIYYVIFVCYRSSLFAVYWFYEDNVWGSVFWLQSRISHIRLMWIIGEGWWIHMGNAYYQQKLNDTLLTKIWA